MISVRAGDKGGGRGGEKMVEKIEGGGGRGGKGEGGVYIRWRDV